MIAEVSPLDFIFAVAASIVAMLVARVLLYLIELIKSQAKKLIVYYGLFAVLIVTGAIPIYYVSAWFLGLTLSTPQFRLVFCAWLSQLVVGYQFYRLTHHLAEEQQYDDRPQRVQVVEAREPPITIPVRHLHRVSSNANARLDLNWRTFSNGIDFLVEQIECYNPRIEPDLCVGINKPGGAIASIFSEKLHDGERAVGFVRAAGGPPHRVVEAVLPKSLSKRQDNKAQTILLADIEVKKGSSIKSVSDFLQNKYGPDVRIYVAVLVASQVRNAITHITQLNHQHEGVFAEDQKCLPNFLAFTCFNKVRLFR